MSANVPETAELDELFEEIGNVIATSMSDDARGALNAFRVGYRKFRLADEKRGAAGMELLQAALEAYPAARVAMDSFAVPEAVSTLPSPTAAAPVKTTAPEPEAPAAADVTKQSDATSEGAPCAPESAEFAYPVHPAAKIFPMMPQKELQDLADDIKINGLREPIVVFEGRKVDGRNREAACLLAGVEPRYREWSGEGSVVAWVLSVNLHRRHLTDTQRALIGARAREAFALEAEERRNAKLAQNKGATVSADLRYRELSRSEEGKSAEVAAAQLQVSTRAVEQASAVIARGAEALVDAVTSGAVSLDAAAAVADLPHEEQRKLVEEGGVKAKASEMRKAKKQKRDAAKEDSKPKPSAEDRRAAHGGATEADAPDAPPSQDEAGDQGAPGSGNDADARVAAIGAALQDIARACHAVSDLVPERNSVSTLSILEGFVSGVMDRPFADDPKTMREGIESTARALIAEPKGRARARPTEAA